MPFQIGDRVMCTSNYQRYDSQQSLVGRIGTVRSLVGGRYGVQFDQRFDGGHDLHSHALRPQCPAGYGWFIPHEFLELERPTGVAHGAGSIGEFFKKLEAQACTSGYCSLQSS